MKFLIVFALFAVAFADVEPFRLRDAPAPAIEGSVDHPLLINVVESPIPVDALDNTANIVKVVDFVKGVFNTYGGVKGTFEDAEPSYDTTVKFVDEAINEVQVDNENLLVKVVEGLAEAAPSDFTVKVVDEAVNDNASPVKVESLVEEIALSDIAVNFVDESANDLSDVEAGPVNFVNEAVNNVVLPAEIAPSFDTYAGISKLIKNAQEEKYGGSSTDNSNGRLPKDFVPTAVKVVENAVNMGQMLAADIEESYEDFVYVHSKAEAYEDVKFPRGKVFDNPMLR